MRQIITTPHTIHLQQLMPKFHRPGIDHIHHTRINQYKSLEFHCFYFKQHTHTLHINCTAMYCSGRMWTQRSSKIQAIFWKELLGHVGVVPLLESIEHSESDDESYEAEVFQRFPRQICSADARWTRSGAAWLYYFSFSLITSSSKRGNCFWKRQLCYDSLGTLLSDSWTTNKQGVWLHFLPFSICLIAFAGIVQEARKSSHNYVDKSCKAL